MAGINVSRDIGRYIVVILNPLPRFLRGTADFRLDLGMELDSWTYTHTGTLQQARITCFFRSSNVLYTFYDLFQVSQFSCENIPFEAVEINDFARYAPI